MTKIYNKIHQATIAITFTILLLFSSTSVTAQDINPESYRFKFSNLNSASDISSDIPFSNPFPSTPINPNHYLKTGFSYIKTAISFIFTISDLSINFNTLTPNTPSIQTNKLTVSNNIIGGYSITLLANQPLTMKNSSISIPDITPGIWKNNSTYGFGYSLTNNNYFNPFPYTSPQTIISSNNLNFAETTQVTYKVNINNSQSIGDYENIINFIATPIY